MLALLRPSPLDFTPPAQTPTPPPPTNTHPQPTALTHTPTHASTHTNAALATHTPTPSHAHTSTTTPHAHTHTHTNTHTHAHQLQSAGQVRKRESPHYHQPPPNKRKNLNLRDEALAIRGMENIQMWDPEEEELLSPSLLAGIATPPPTNQTSPHQHQLQHPPHYPLATVSVRGSTVDRECAYPTNRTKKLPPRPPPHPQPWSPQGSTVAQGGRWSSSRRTPGRDAITTPQPSINAQLFIPGTPWISTRTQQTDQALQPMGKGAGLGTSPPPTPPSSPQRTLPPAIVSLYAAP